MQDHFAYRPIAVISAPQAIIPAYQTVIAAKAGIQLFAPMPTWIPAFAGMTKTMEATP